MVMYLCVDCRKVESFVVFVAWMCPGIWCMSAVNGRDVGLGHIYLGESGDFFALVQKGETVVTCVVYGGGVLVKAGAGRIFIANWIGFEMVLHT